MNMASVDFNGLVDSVVRDKNVSHLKNVIKRELLHYDILFCLSNAGLLRRLTFQGGTALRLCYGGLRRSEDLDFCGGGNLSPEDKSRLKPCIEEYLSLRYGLPVRVNEPRGVDENKASMINEVRVWRWWVSLDTEPNRPDIPHVRVKLELADVPAHRGQLVPLRSNYGCLPDGYAGMMLRAEHLDEIMADKIIALVHATQYIRYRDMWDLPWLSRNGAKLDIDLVRKKLTDYGEAESFGDLLSDRIQSLPEIAQGKEMQRELRGYLPLDYGDKSLGQPEFLSYLESETRRLLERVQRWLYQGKSPEDEWMGL